MPGRQHKLAVAFRQFEPTLTKDLVTPPQPMAEDLGVERYARIEVRHPHRDRVDLPRQSRLPHIDGVDDLPPP